MFPCQRIAEAWERLSPEVGSGVHKGENECREQLGLVGEDGQDWGMGAGHYRVGRGPSKKSEMRIRWK